MQLHQLGEVACALPCSAPAPGLAPTAPGRIPLGEPALGNVQARPKGELTQHPQGPLTQVNLIGEEEAPVPDRGPGGHSCRARKMDTHSSCPQILARAGQTQAPPQPPPRPLIGTADEWS